MDCAALVVYFVFDIQAEHYLFFKRRFTEMKRLSFHSQQPFYRGNIKAMLRLALM